MPRRALALRTRGRQCIWQRRRQLCPLLPPSQWLLKQLSLSQKHLLFEHCRTTLCTLNRTLECQAQRQAPTAGAGREQQAPAARSWSGGGKPCSARGDRSLHSPRAGWQLPGPYWHLGAPCLHPSPTRSDWSVGMCAWQVPACHTWVSAASLLLPRSSLWFSWFGASSVPRW